MITEATINGTQNGFFDGMRERHRLVYIHSVTNAEAPQSFPWRVTCGSCVATFRKTVFLLVGHRNGR